ncbi:MAG: efflux RND transporter periplasmic adaptor subunit [Marinagarivorans sp.]
MKRALFFIVAMFWGLSAKASRDFDCMIEPLHSLDLRSPVVGLIQEIHVQRGVHVNLNDPLVTIDSKIESSAVKVAKFKSEATGAIQVAESKLVAAQEKAKRSKQLYDENFISAQALDEAEAERKLAEAEVKSSRENNELAKLEHQQTQEQLNRRILRSPFPGVVMNVFLSPGALVDSSETKKSILKLVQTDRLKVVSYVPLSLFGKIKVNDDVVIKPESPLEGEFRAKVTTVDGVIESTSGTFGVVVELNNEAGYIPVGSRCKLIVNNNE